MRTFHVDARYLAHVEASIAIAMDEIHRDKVWRAADPATRAKHPPILPSFVDDAKTGIVEVTVPPVTTVLPTARVA